MLNAYQAPVLTDQDRSCLIGWCRMTIGLAKPTRGLTFRRCDSRLTLLQQRRADRIEPILCLKLELLMFHDALSDHKVFAKAKTDIAYQLFLGLGLNDHLPDVSTLQGFRSRLGVEGHKAVFHQLLSGSRRLYQPPHSPSAPNVFVVFELPDLRKRNVYESACDAISCRMEITTSSPSSRSACGILSAGSRRTTVS